MSPILKVQVGERWPQEPRTRWVLQDAAGPVLQSGHGDASRWPAAERCEAVFSAPQASLLRLRLPARLPAREVPGALAGAAEERLLDAPERSHFTLVRREGDTAEALAIDRERLRNVLTQFQALGRPLAAARSGLLALPLASAGEGWRLALGAEAAVLYRPAAEPLALDPDPAGGPPPMLAALLAAAAMPPLQVQVEAGQPAPDLAAWGRQLGLAPQRGADYAWHAPAVEVDLLHGEFVSRQNRSAFWRSVRPMVWLAGLALAVDLVAGGARLVWQRHQLAAREAGATLALRSAFPALPVVAPAAQLRQQRDLLRAPQGLLRDDDALALLAAASEPLGADGEAALRELRYENRRLVLVFARRPARLAALPAALAARGLKVVERAGSDGLPIVSIEKERRS